MSLAVLILHNYTLSSHKTPWEDLEVCNWIPGKRGRRSSPESGGSGGALGRGRRLRGGGAHHGSIWARVGVWKAAGEVTRRRRAATAAGASAPARRAARLGHKRHGELE
jgi:hypothetical protein